jgi:hypothetical protein
MTDPFADDSWDELNRELGVEKSPAQVPASQPETEIEASRFEEEIIDSPEAPVEDADDEGEEGEESEGEALDGAEGPGGDEPAGPGRKRRRRRRRRKKGGPEGEGEAEAEVVAGEETSEPARGEFGEPEYDTGEMDLEPAGLPLAAEEDTAGEVLRELIATWNVPSWDAIVTGLYRPER